MDTRQLLVFPWSKTRKVFFCLLLPIKHALYVIMEHITIGLESV